MDEFPCLGLKSQISTPCFLQLPLCTHFYDWLQNFPYFLDYKPHVTASYSTHTSIPYYISANLTQVIFVKKGVAPTQSPSLGTFLSFPEGLILFQLLD